MGLTSLFPAQGLSNFVDESASLAASNSLGAGVLGGSGLFRSTISNRSSIADIANNLKVNVGIERLQVNQIYQIKNEFGPNGEAVFAVLNDRQNLFRYVGNWSAEQTGGGLRIVNTNGTWLASTGEYIEITFYGTGLNMVRFTGMASPINAQVSVDGNTASTVAIVSSASTTYTNRNYQPNVITPIVSGLALGIHTVKISGTAGNADGMQHCGWEILNENASLKVNPGAAYIQGKKRVVSTQQSLSYDSDFTNSYGTVGVRGGRVLVYLDSEGVVRKDIQYVEPTTQYTTSASHGNEEPVRPYHFREFQVNRGDDFAGFGSITNRNYALSDNSTILRTDSALIAYNGTYEALIPNVNGAYVNINFVGTGLDVEIVQQVNLGNHTIIVDGVTVINNQSVFASSSMTGTLKTYKIVSGLPYGSHSVRIQNANAASQYPYFRTFIVYQPKKPTLPSGALELGDYNLMAAFVENLTAAENTHATGILRKSVTREVVTRGAGTWTVNLDNQTAAGQYLQNTSTGAILEYTAWGRGVDVRSYSGPNRMNDIDVYWNGVLLSTANFSISYNGGAASGTGPSIVIRAHGGFVFVPATGKASFNNGSFVPGAGLAIYKATPEVFTLRLDGRNGGNSLIVDCYDIITPIHTHRGNEYASYGMEYPIPAQLPFDNRRVAPVSSLDNKKPWAQVIGGNVGSITTSSSALVPMQEMTTTMKTNGGPVRIFFSVMLQNTSANQNSFVQIVINGQPIPFNGSGMYMSPGSSTVVALTLVNSYKVHLPAGIHKFDLYWANGAGVAQSPGNGRIMIVEETD